MPASNWPRKPMSGSRTSAPTKRSATPVSWARPRVARAACGCCSKARARFAFGPTRQLTPSLQLGVQRDGGDAENGAGFNLGGTLRYADGALGLSVETSGRYLLGHEDSAYREWGASATIRVDPGIPGRGLTLSAVPSLDADASGGAERLWSARDARGLSGYGFDTAMRLQAQVGYGFSAFEGKGSMAPFAALSSSGPRPRTARRRAPGARPGASDVAGGHAPRGGRRTARTRRRVPPDVARERARGVPQRDRRRPRCGRAERAERGIAVRRQVKLTPLRHQN